MHPQLGGVVIVVGEVDIDVDGPVGRGEGQAPTGVERPFDGTHGSCDVGVRGDEGLRGVRSYLDCGEDPHLDFNRAERRPDRSITGVQRLNLHDQRVE